MDTMNSPSASDEVPASEELRPTRDQLLTVLQSISRYDHPVLLELAQRLFTGKSERIQQLVKKIEEQQPIIDQVRPKVHQDSSPPQLAPSVVGVRGESLLSTLSKLAGVANRGNMSLAMSDEEAAQIEHEVLHCYGVASSQVLQERPPLVSQSRYESPDIAMDMAQAYSTKAEMIETVMIDVVPKLSAEWKAQALQEVKDAFHITEEDTFDEATELPFDTMMEFYVINLASELDELLTLPPAKVYETILSPDAKRKLPMLRCLIDNLDNPSFARPMITHLLQASQSQLGTCVYLSDELVRNGAATLHTVDDQQPEIRGLGQIVLTNREIAIELNEVPFGTQLVPPELIAHIQPFGETSNKVFTQLFSADGIK